VTSHSFIKAILSKDSERCGKTTLEIFAFFVLVGKLWWPMQLSGHVAIYRTCGDLYFGNFPTCNAAEGSSNPGSFGATTSGFSESACGAIFLFVVCVCMEMCRITRQEEECKQALLYHC
jgi:hypothetical protein